MSKRKQEPEPNHELMFKSVVYQYQQDYNEYKRLLHKSIDTTFIGTKGEFCYIANNYAEKIKKLETQLIIDRNNVEVEQAWLDKEKENDNSEIQRRV